MALSHEHIGLLRPNQSKITLLILLWDTLYLTQTFNVEVSEFLSARWNDYWTLLVRNRSPCNANSYYIWLSFYVEFTFVKSHTFDI